MLKGSGFTLKQAVLHLLKTPPSTANEIGYMEGLDEFLMVRKEHLSLAQYENYRIRGTAFGEFVGPKTHLCSITADHVERWLRAKGVSKKTHNNYRGDIAAIFSWFVAAPRKWIAENPVNSVSKFSKRALRNGAPERMEILKCRELMAYLENEKPHWCAMFALALFAAIRPDLRNGEIAELARCVARDGLGAYVNQNVLHLTVEISKDGRPRQTTLPENLRAWLTAYPLTKDAINPADYVAYMAIRKRFAVPHDGLRHTCISAHVAVFGSIGAAAREFGTSETIIRDHYLARMSRAEGEEFYSIRPAKPAAACLSVATVSGA